MTLESTEREVSRDNMRTNMRQTRQPGARCRDRRGGATTVEFAIVGPAVVLLLFGFMVLSLGVFRYQQVAYLAREGARYASTHGAQYRSDMRLAPGDPATWTQEIRDQAILPQTAALDPNNLDVTATWSAGDNRANAAEDDDEFRTTIDNAVTVTVSYQWIPELFLTGPLTLRSTATMPMAH